MTATIELLDADKILQLLDPEGPLSKRLKHFEVRNEQKQMLVKLIEAFNEDAVALIEAGTGTGKSLAYLIPALLAAVIWKEKVVISTNTISLQEQILNKDLPLLVQALDVEVKAVLVKGMNNYVCLRKLEEIEFEKRLLPDPEREIIDLIQIAATQQNKGCRSELPLQAPSHLWELVSADYETCNNTQCPHYNECHYFNARKEASDANLLVVNHHLLLTDLFVRAETNNYQSTAILPFYPRIILDEAHNFEEIATHYFATRISRLDLLKTLSKLTSEKNNALSGKLPQLKSYIQKHLELDLASSIMVSLSIDLPTLRKDLIKSIAESFGVMERLTDSKGNEEHKLRLIDKTYETDAWKNEIAPLAKQTSSLLERYANELNRLEEMIKDFDDSRLIEKTKGILFEIKALGNRLLNSSKTLEKLTQFPPSKEAIRWLESTMVKVGFNLTLVEATLDISSVLAKYLFSPFRTIALLSATLATGGSFKFIKEQLGLTKDKLEKPIIEWQSASPFDYKKQALMIIPKDIPEPSASHYLPAAIDAMWQAIDGSQGNAFILFTSYGMLKSCYEALEGKLKEHKYQVLRHGDENRATLLRKFIEKDRSILFGTDSFWEGVDVMGDALRLVIIAKLPFKVPTEPMIQAKSEALQAKGLDPFTKLLLPQAAIKFKQGFGRLIRNKKDRGCIVCLDTRVISKNYGQFLLKQLPECPRVQIDTKQIKEEMQKFYKKTYYLTQ